jgi:two-component system OmpR family sensor kinase
MSRTRRTGGRPWTLRARLVVALVLLAAVGLAGFGVSSVFLIRQSLMSRIDERLQGLGESIPAMAAIIDQLPPTRRTELPTDFRLAFFSSAGAVRLTRGQPEGEATGPALPVINASTLPRQARGEFTVDDRTGGPGWRVHVVALPGGDIAAVAMSLATTETTIDHLVTIEVGAGTAILLCLGGVALLVVRVGLRPLRRIEATAEAIAAGQLDSRIQQTDSRTETGRLGMALNTMVERLSSALHQREHSERRLRRFVADASHELRTPLTSIRGFAELYRRGGATGPTDVDRLLGRIESEATRMGQLVEDLLLLARLDQEPALDLTEVDLTLLAEEVVHDVHARDTQRPVRLVLPGRPVRVVGDEHRLRQVVTNLVDNAVTHTRAGTAVTVTVGESAGPCSAAEDPATVVAGDCGEGAHAVLEVADDGDGIPPDVAPHVFDRFYRTDTARRRRRGGTGLGLAIVVAILQAHHARIELRTAHGSGAAFRVVLPLS